jgi:hypothetical protein
LNCVNASATSGIGIMIGSGSCVSSSTGRGYVWNNTVYQYRDIGIWFSNSCGQHLSGGQAINNLVISTGGNGAIGGNGVGSVTVATNRTTGAVTDCFNSSTDLYLKTGTNPCVDAGTAVATVTTDFHWARRPQGSTYDIGPCERQSGALLAAPTGLKVQ